jgi:hypothetical protein
MKECDLVKRLETAIEEVEQSPNQRAVRPSFLREVLGVLKKQVPEYPMRKKGKHGWFFYCPKCETILNDMARPKYCDRCGQAVKWQ